MKSYHFFLAVLLGVAVAACQSVGTDELIDPSLVENAVVESASVAVIEPGVSYCGNPVVQTLWAGQDINAGTVTIYNDETTLYVTVYSTYGFQSVSENIKIWTGTDLQLLPNANGAPINGKFPYKMTVTEGNMGTISIPLSDIATYNANVCGVQSIFVVVHGDVLASRDGSVIKGETAYGGDQTGSGNRWWYYFTYVPQCCTTPPPPTGTLQTAFGKFDKTGVYGTGYVFTVNKKSNPEKYASFNLTQNRWGWGGNVKMDGTYTFPLWAGAGLNNTANGTLVGSITVTKFGEYTTVSYATLPGFSIAEVHIYVGDMSPTTIAPGQYGHIANIGDSSDEYLSSYSNDFVVVDTNADGVWIIAHAVVYGNY